MNNENTMTIEEAKERYPHYDENLPWYTTEVGQNFIVTKEMQQEEQYKKKLWDTTRHLVAVMGYKYHKIEHDNGDLEFKRYA